ncbi:MAG: DUF5110 domain-containing protein [Bacteroidales bacterium]|nr:DUF5110 domain-containing protein [Bacteroidales bacterium]
MKKRLIWTTLLTMGATLWAQQMPKVTFVTPSIVHVQWSADGQNADNETGVCTYTPQVVKCKVKTTDDKVTYKSACLLVTMNRQTGALTFADVRSGKLLLAEDPTKPREAEPVVQERIIYDEKSAHMEETANGKVTVKDILRRDTIGVSTRYRNHFLFTDDEALYGLGCHMEDYMNLNGKTVYLTQHNLKASVPVLNSTNGYGLLFDAGCAMKMEDGCIEYDAAKTLDYYFMMGENLDALVAQYRWLTGSCPMMPKYMFGYTQSKERYCSQQELIQVLGEYRRRQVPIDMIVQDWNYWPEGWGYMKMDARYYPDPKALADSIHAMHARLMVSIWPNPQYCPQERDFREKGYMLEHSVYDVFNPEARKYYWGYADREFFSKGFDAWWCDSSEPLDADWNRPIAPTNGKAYGWDSQAQRYELNKSLLSDALGAERSNLYSLYHAMGIYENQRAATDQKRVLNLTRSSYAGQQRYATVTWNGDTHASWQSFREQIPGGLNFMATGCPYWSVDIGSFFTRGGQRWFYKGEFPQGVKDDGYKEYYTRMLQWGTFLPMMRSHGSDTPREIWRFGEPGTPYYEAILKMIQLRYRLLPYTYSLAARVTLDNYTMTRLLAFDFANDRKVWDIKDEFMLGNILVCPVTEPGAKQRTVYLPAGTTWWDFWTNEKLHGANTLQAEAPIDRLPLYVKAGTILPLGPVVQYADQPTAEPIELRIYAGADGEFTLYDDQGSNYDCEKGQYATTRFVWNDKAKTLTLEDRQGNFDGMKKEQTFKIRLFVVEEQGILPYLQTIEKTITYSGKKMKVKLPTL